MGDNFAKVDPTMDLTVKFEQLINETTALRREVAQLKVSLTKQNEQIIKLIKEQVEIAKQQDDVSQQSKTLPESKIINQEHLFPINSQEELEAAENSINDDNKRELTQLVKALLTPGGFKKSLNKIFGMDLILEYNVDGRHQKKRMLDFPKILDLLFQATNKTGWNYKYFLDDLRIGFKSAKNRHFKMNWSLRKKHVHEPNVKIEEVLIPFRPPM